ncbi:lipase family protein [Myxococcus sp. 1LA]
MSTTPALNLYQKTFLLTRESNQVGDTQGDTKTLAKSLQTKLNTYLALPDVQKAMEGQWSVVWGPAVFEAQESATSYADNVMYVAASPDKSVYVVAIAGTNMSSDYDKNKEDNSVNTTKLWTDAFPSLSSNGVPSGIKPWPVISTGTALGVNNLLGMTDTLTTQKSLLDFLRSLSGTGTKTLIFGGHSLGGALAPTLALALFNPSGGPLSLRDWGHVYVLPVAGPTPGNKGFSEFFQKVFPPLSTNEPQNHYAWNQNIWNSLDAVPHAWVVSMLKEIPTLYPAKWDGGQVPSDITKAVNAAVAASELGGLLPGPYTQLPNIQVPGTLYGPMPITTEAEFFAQVGYQHVVAYDIHFGIQALVSEGAKSALQKNLKRWWNSLSRMAPQDASRAAAGR